MKSNKQLLGEIDMLKGFVADEKMVSAKLLELLQLMMHGSECHDSGVNTISYVCDELNQLRCKL